METRWLFNLISSSFISFSIKFQINEFTLVPMELLRF